MESWFLTHHLAFGADLYCVGQRPHPDSLAARIQRCAKFKFLQVRKWVIHPPSISNCSFPGARLEVNARTNNIVFSFCRTLLTHYLPFSLYYYSSLPCTSPGRTFQKQKEMILSSAELHEVWNCLRKCCVRDAQGGEADAVSSPEPHHWHTPKLHSTLNPKPKIIKPCCASTPSCMVKDSAPRTGTTPRCPMLGV